MAVRLNLSERFREPDFQLSVFFFSASDDAEIVNVLLHSTSSEQI